jgi:hypothetical protein
VVPEGSSGNRSWMLAITSCCSWSAVIRNPAIALMITHVARDERSVQSVSPKAHNGEGVRG